MFKKCFLQDVFHCFREIYAVNLTLISFYFSTKEIFLWIQIDYQLCLRLFFIGWMDMLGDDFEPFLAAYEQPRTYGLRVNTAKISCEEFEQIVPFEVKKIPWVSNGYFYNEDVRPSVCSLSGRTLLSSGTKCHDPASRIPVEPGEYVLDMCAAPGGKATAVGSALKGEGLLVANDISTTRARALLRNLELFGIPNLFVANEKPEKW